MGDDPHIPDALIRSEQQPAAGASAATGGNNIFINNLGKTGFTIIVSLVGLALGLAISAIVIVIVVGSMDRAANKAAIEAAEKRAMDMAWLAKQEARIAQDQNLQMQLELSKRGIHIRADGH
jgi:hypothetical protein